MLDSECEIVVDTILKAAKPVFGGENLNHDQRGMRKDLLAERICAKEQIPLALPPARFPQAGLKAARLALAGEAEGWTPEFSRAVYAANFALAKDISDDATLAEILERLKIDPAGAFAAANAPENKERLKARTEEARARGIFGAPSFIAGEELFWGNDRLKEAIAHAALEAASGNAR